MNKLQLLIASIAAIDASMLEQLPRPKPPRIYTDADQQRRENAEAKRQRKAAKRVKTRVDLNAKVK